MLLKYDSTPVALSTFEQSQTVVPLTLVQAHDGRSSAEQTAGGGTATDLDGRQQVQLAPGCLQRHESEGTLLYDWLKTV